MFDAQRQGGWANGAAFGAPAAGFGQPTTSSQPKSNPFAQPPAANNPFAALSAADQNSGSSSFGKPPEASAVNPFQKPNVFAPAQNQQASTPAFALQSNTSGTDAQRGNPFAPKANGFASNSSAVPSLSSSSAMTANSTNTTVSAAGGFAVSDFVKPAWPAATSDSNLKPGKRKSDTAGNPNPRFGQKSKSPVPPSQFGKPAHTEASKLRQGLSQNRRSGGEINLDGRGKQIYTQLAKDGIRPPEWPTNPGSRSQRGAMDALRESHRNYRDKARKSLIKAGLIDDPDVPKRLDEAIPFIGICEEMCPEWEKITRIVENDVKVVEKEDINGDKVAIPPLMVKRLARSAAGQDAPLPMDVRSTAALRRTLNYLIDELIPTDDQLPIRHNFLWDRTRAVRIDFSMQQSGMGAKEFRDMVFCLETIVRFHVTALHLLSQPGFAAEDFSEQQEVEQLGKALLSLKQAYEDSTNYGVECENRAEFLGYFLVYNAHDPSLMDKLESWGLEFWEHDGLRTAMSLIEAIQNTSRLHGPLAPFASTNTALDAGSIFFSIIESAEISYTMACFAEIHFNHVRRSMMRVIRRAYARPRDGPKDLTPSYLQQKMRLDSEQQTIEFFELHGFEFDEANGQMYLVVNARQDIEEPRIPHAFSRNLVERKRSARSLPEIIHETVYQIPGTGYIDEVSEEESMFVTGSRDAPLEAEDIASLPTEPVKPNNGIAAGSPSTRFGLNLGATPAVSMTATEDGVGNGSPANPFFAKPATPPFGAPVSNSQLATKPDGSLNGATSPWFPKPQESQKVEAPAAQPASLGASTTETPAAKSLFNANTTAAPPAASSSTPLFGIKGQLGLPPSTTPDSSSSWLPKPGASASSDQQADASGSILSGAISTTKPDFQFPAFGPSPTIAASASTATPASPKVAPLEVGKTPPIPSTSLFPAASAVQPQNTPQPSSAPPKTSTTSLFAPEPVAAPPPFKATPPPQTDPMGDFTRWFVCGDRGLMETNIEEFLLINLLEDIWNNFEAEEDERKQKEEDERMWAEAERFRERSLKITYFYRWLDKFRKARIVKRIRLEKEKARQWHSPDNIKKRKAAELEARKRHVDEVTELIRKKAKRAELEAEQVREPTPLGEESVENALIASGILAGVRDERAAARRAAKVTTSDTDSILGEPAPIVNRLHAENQRRRKHGLKPLNRLPEPKTHSPGSKTARLKALISGGRDSLSMSTGSLRNSTFSSSFRSSLGYNQSRVSKPASNVRDPYWRMKASGLVQMPNGEYLHESLALPMLREGKRFPGIGNYGLPPADTLSPTESPPETHLLALDYSPPLSTNGQLVRIDDDSASPAAAAPSPAKRKRLDPEPESNENDPDLVAYREEEPAGKVTKGDDITGDGSEQDFLKRMEMMLQEVEEEGHKA